MRRLNAGWVVKRSSAEREKFRVSARLKKSSSHFNSIADHCTRAEGQQGLPRALMPGGHG